MLNTIIHDPGRRHKSKQITDNTPSKPPHIYICSDDPEFDNAIIRSLQLEDFTVDYLPLLEDDTRTFRNALSHLSDDLELGQTYAIVAYGAAATAALSFYTTPQPGCAALVAYYPTTIPAPKTKYPPHLHVLCHLAATQGFAPAFPSYTYGSVEPGFAESDLEEWDKVAADLAWTRTLALLRRAFNLRIDLERTWEEHVALRYVAKDVAGTVRTMGNTAHVTHVPTLTGGIGQKDLFLFYREYFIPRTPPSASMRLASRTIGTDRVVDEVVLSFEHTQEVPWMLPDVPPTDKQVTVPLVSVVCIRGGSLASEHVYWDQASVLVQVGLLDPKLVPQDMKEKGLERLPVVGAEAANRILDERSEPSNALLASWKDRPKGDPGVKMPSRPKPAATGGDEQR